MSERIVVPSDKRQFALYSPVLWASICLATALMALGVSFIDSLAVSPLYGGLLLGLGLMSAVMCYVMMGQSARLKLIEKSESEYRSAYEQSRIVSGYMGDLPVGFFVLGGDGVFRYVNQVFARWVGVAADELISGKARFVDFMDDPDAPASGGVGKTTLRDAGGDTFTAYVIHENRDHQGGQDAVRAVVLRDLSVLPRSSDGDAHGEGNGVAGASVPSWLFDDAPVGIAFLSDQGIIKKSNQEFARYVGVANNELVGVELTGYLAPEDREYVAAALSKLMMGTAREVRVDARFSLEGGVERAGSLHFSGLSDDCGGDFEEGDLVLHVIDETEHKHLEVQFTQSQKMQAVGQLAGGIAHDFNNLLTAMIGFSDLLLERHGPDDPSFADLMQIKQNANRATNLVRQLLAFSRKQTLKPVVIDPTEILADMTHLLGRLIGEQVELQLSHEPGAYLIQADRGQFDQVIINLTVNARDAMPGGGTISIKTRNETVSVAVQRGSEIMAPGAYLVIGITDTGTGIARENLDRIFEPFYSTKDVGAGTGLGLSTVYGIVRQSDGFIFVESAIGLGTTFTIYLPAYGPGEDVGAEAAAVAADMAQSDRRAATAARQVVQNKDVDLTGDAVILLVEDEDAVRMFGSRALRNKGYTVIEADNGEAGLDALNSTDLNIDLIVSDVVMPGMDGHTFVQLVRHEMPDMKVILMSGYAEDVFREEISRDPSIHFLAKPFSLKTLAGTVKDVLAE